MRTNQKKYLVKFKGGSSEVDKIVFDYISTSQKEIKGLREIPLFFNLSNLLNNYKDKNLLDFYSYVLKNHTISNSQLFQDLFVLFILKGKKNGKYLEFGATNGVELSNTFTLEKHFAWEGVLAEPSPQWTKSLKENRPKNNIINKCIYSETDKNINFFVSDIGVLSTIEEFKNSDISSMPGNTKARNEKGYNIPISTISLNDVFINYFDGQKIDYMSIDTEGSELLILESFDFNKFGPKIITVEHNFTPAQEKLNALFKKNNYTRYFPIETQFDAWYVRND